MKPQRYLVVVLVFALLALPSIIFFDKIYNFFRTNPPQTNQTSNQPAPQITTDPKLTPIKVFSYPSGGYQFSYKSIYDIRPEIDHFNLLNSKNITVATIKVIDSTDRDTEENIYSESMTNKGYSVTVEDHDFSSATAKIFQAVKDNNQADNLLTLTNSSNKTILINTVDPSGFANYPDDIYMIAETFSLIE